MTALCHHCDVPMKKQGTSKGIKATEYYCPICGQHWTKVQGEKGYHRGQIINLPQEYLRRT
jgi:Zn finger protein HypA/HybF involved in hydrogenase expression